MAVPAGEGFLVEVAFPEDYRAENLKGKTAQFAVKLKEVKESVLPPIDEEFLKLHSVEEGAGEAGLVREVPHAALEKERDKGVRNRLKEPGAGSAAIANPVEIPQALIAQEIPRAWREEAVSRMGMANVPKDKHAKPLPGALFEQQAQRRVALGC